MSNHAALTRRPIGTMDWIRTHKTELALVSLAAGATVGGYVAYRNMRDLTQTALERDCEQKHTLKVGNLLTYTVEVKPAKPRREALKLVHAA